MQSVIRFYDSAEKAQKTAQLLHDNGFGSDAVFVMNPAAEGEAVAQSDMISTLKAGNALGEHADEATDALARGRHVVATVTYFGHGAMATHLMDSTGPVDTEALVPEVTFREADPAAPLSSLLGLSVLSKDAAPLSDYIGIDCLSEYKDDRSRVFPVLQKGPTKDSLLSKNAAPLSSLFGMKTISGKSGSSWTSSFGMSLLSGKSGGSWTSSFGMPLLSSNPAPLSSLFGMSTLSKD